MDTAIQEQEATTQYSWKPSTDEQGVECGNCGALIEGFILLYNNEPIALYQTQERVEEVVRLLNE